MPDTPSTSLTVGISCLALVVSTSIPHLQQIWKRFSTKKTVHSSTFDKHEDEDGIATDASQKSFSSSIHSLIGLLAAGSGTALCLASAILNTVRDHPFLMIEQWLQFATWIVLLFQTVTVFTAPNSQSMFTLGAWTGLASLLLTIAIPCEDLSLWSRQVYPSPHRLHVTLSAVQFVAAAIVFFASLSIPRRPDVYLDGKLIDRQYTVSLLKRYTFSWANHLLYFANKNRNLSYDDLPIVSHDLRADTLKQRFEAVGKKDKLWITIFWSHKFAFMAQWVLLLLTAISSFLPQIVLFAVLKLLEARDTGNTDQIILWLLVLGMGASVAIAAWLESILFYIAAMKLGVPIYEQLSAVIFGKAIRRKDVKGAAKTDFPDEGNGDIAINKNSGLKDEDTAVDTGEDEEVAKTKQSTLNLIGVDSKRVADFATYNYLFLHSAVKLVIAITFLVKLIGWIPLLCGFIAPAAIGPINYIASSRYAAAQDSLMKFRDQKMATVTEALQGIRQIKFSALENDWYEKILKTRRKELQQQWRVFCFDALMISIWIFGPVFLSAISLATYAYINKGLSASVAFTTVSVFEALEMTLAVMPELVTELIDALISARRIQAFLDSPERTESTEAGDQISFQQATIAWPSDSQDEEADTFKLQDLDIAFPNGELSVVSGRTGSGKSLLLSAIISEADVLSGKVTVPRSHEARERHDAKAHRLNWMIKESIAYVSQTPWIENATIRDNILFGLPFDNSRYRKVLEVCALEKDMEMMQDGDMTDIGANGINLSGGQKWRVSFARALYSRAGILILDDIFSAVDAHVGRHLYEKALTGELGNGRTRILVTHHVALCLPKTKYSVLLENGRILQAGLTEDLRRDGLLKDILAHDNLDADKEKIVEESAIDDGGHLFKVNTNKSNRSRRYSTVSDIHPDLARRPSRAAIEEEENLADPPKKFTEDEKRATGAVKFKIWNIYLRSAGGYAYWAFILVLFMIWIVAFLGRSYWMSTWTRKYSTETLPSMHVFQQFVDPYRHIRTQMSTVQIDEGLSYYVGIYLAISLGCWAIGTVRYMSVFYASIKASKTLFEKLAFTILRTPLRFLDTTPVGRILNRFTADFNMIDSKVAPDLAFMLHNVVVVLSVIIAGAFVSPFMILFAILLLAASWYVASLYLAGAREVKRLESNAKSPIFEQFGSVLTGISTIRAFDKASSYIERMETKINTHCQSYWYLFLFNRWMSVRLNLVGALFSTITGVLVVSIAGIDASLAGFALSFSLQLSDGVYWFLRQYANVELNFNASERVIEYSELETETQEGMDAPAAWPTKGELEVNDLVVTYAADLTPVLRGLTFSVRETERVGVVGRTGAGKSSLTLALFRFLEAQSGSIHIDGVDISKIKLYDLRSRLAIIPQDPVLFSGTIRSNLDPFDQHSDTELRDALARVHLIPTSSASTAPSGTTTPARSSITSTTNTNTNIFRSLSSPISEGGLNLSQGQRQLLCLARAIVSRPKIMVLDEATSSVDMETDTLIQQSIRNEFDNSTLIVIAHRLSTIADFDRILVLGEGRVLEFDSPENLMGMENGVFKEMVEQSGERAVLEGVISGKKR